VGHNETARARLEWNVYPIGIPFLVVPLTWMADKIAAAFGIDLEAAAVRKSPLLLELLFASLITAAAAALLFWYLRQRLSLRRSLLCWALCHCLLFHRAVFGTWSSSYYRMTQGTILSKFFLPLSRLVRYAEHSSVRHGVSSSSVLFCCSCLFACFHSTGANMR
jgi:hypothetical protein